MPTESQPNNIPSDPLHPNAPSHPAAKRGTENPGYETQDVNVNGVVVFLGSLAACLVVFFFLCFFLGKLINNGLLAADGPVNRWHEDHSMVGAEVRGQRRQDLTSSPVMAQRELAQIAKSFPLPRVPTDDDNQETADLHAREDLMLNYYTSSPDLPAGKVRIPIARAMQLIAQGGLGSAPPPPTQPVMYGDARPNVTMPLTTGFARTGYEDQQIEIREQKMDYEQAAGEREKTPPQSGTSTTKTVMH